MTDIDAAEDWLDHWTAGVSTQAERAATLSRRVAALTGRAVLHSFTTRFPAPPEKLA
jgi:hypothetical protein